MKAIVTKYHGPTNTRGARISADDGDGNRATISANGSMRPEDNHFRAAEALCLKMGWAGKLVRGSLPTGYVFVWLDGRDTFTVPQS